MPSLEFLIAEVHAIGASVASLGQLGEIWSCHLHKRETFGHSFSICVIADSPTEAISSALAGPWTKVRYESEESELIRTFLSKLTKQEPMKRRI